MFLTGPSVTLMLPERCYMTAGIKSFKNNNQSFFMFYFGTSKEIWLGCGNKKTLLAILYAESENFH